MKGPVPENRFKRTIYDYDSEKLQEGGDYSAESIQVLESCKEKTGYVHWRYRGEGIHHLVYEVIDNSIDELWPVSAPASIVI